jgi:hypothetical protein
MGSARGYERGGSVNMSTKLRPRPQTGVLANKEEKKRAARPASSKTYTYAGTGNKVVLSGSTMTTT